MRLALHIFFFLLLMVYSAHGRSAEIDRELAADLKAAWLYNIPDYANWPNSDKDPTQIGVLGRDPNGVIRALRQQIEKSGGLTTKGRPLRLLDLNLALMSPADADPERIAAVLQACDLLFVSDDAFARWPQLQPILEMLPVLTTGESLGFAERGGIVEFYPDPVMDKLVMRINLPAMRRAGVMLNSTILTLKNVVILEKEAKAE